MGALHPLGWRFCILTFDTCPASLPQSDFSGGLRFIMTMAPSANFSTLVGICQELNGLSSGMPRFSGACDPLQNYTTGWTGDAAPLAWGFQSFTAHSMSDLDAMRNLLGGSVLYFERWD